MREIMQEITLNPINIIVAIITFFGTLFITYLTHLFSRSRKVDELLFTARKEAYTEFMKNFGRAFGPEKLNLQELNPIGIVEIEHERRQKISSIFAQCRLVASPLLEDKLRHLYDLVIKDLENKNPEEKTSKRERDYIGYEVEALMRHDLSAIGTSELAMWRILSIWRRFRLKSKITNK